MSSFSVLTQSATASNSILLAINFRGGCVKTLTKSSIIMCITLLSLKVKKAVVSLLPLWINKNWTLGGLSWWLMALKTRISALRVTSLCESQVSASGSYRRGPVCQIWNRFRAALGCQSIAQDINYYFKVHYIKCINSYKQSWKVQALCCDTI